MSGYWAYEGAFALAMVVIVVLSLAALYVARRYVHRL
jgi:membrane protein implicated in regulation of membrane protease activity